MARGWESKAVENQQQEAADRSSIPTVREDPTRQVQRNTLMLSRSRALADLQLACAPAHRTMLERALKDLDERLAALG